VSDDERTNEEGRLVSLGGLASAHFKERRDDRLVGTFLCRPTIRKTSGISRDFDACGHATQHDCLAQLLGAWLMAIERH
jgi:hypothetical protein